MEHVIKNSDELKQFAQNFLQTLSPGGNQATIIGLSGELGAGKTTFTQLVAELLGVAERVISPTFIIMKNYELTGQTFKHLVHIDAYRLESGKELLALCWEGITTNPKNLILIEWPERVADILPADMQTIHFAYQDETTRIITINGEKN